MKYYLSICLIVISSFSISMQKTRLSTANKKYTLSQEQVIAHLLFQEKILSHLRMHNSLLATICIQIDPHDKAQAAINTIMSSIPYTPSCPAQTFHELALLNYKYILQEEAIQTKLIMFLAKKVKKNVYNPYRQK